MGLGLMHWGLGRCVRERDSGDRWWGRSDGQSAVRVSSCRSAPHRAAPRRGKWPKLLPLH
ncbi:hypothetical protein RR46_05872 [Papilio xuthus]|uniref:Uncharacterized protein n=1 Tax=Papilio xuthus TaxID=66420 RepID=A0A194PU08_PAPXU|nr:hypothetical protein RR46_05872 [Papilio xuthus]